MRAVVQRVSRAKVAVAGEIVGQIDLGLMVLLGISPSDNQEKARWLANKIVDLRIFEDQEGKMNLGLLEVAGSLLVVSQFTLYGDCRKGRRPNFMAAASPEIAVPLYETFVAALRETGAKTETGRFGAMMEVSLVNSGPVTLILDTEDRKEKES